MKHVPSGTRFSRRLTASTSLRRAVREAVQCHFEEGSRPGIIRLHIVKDEVIPACNFLVT
jgi:hypothetical protein